MAIVNPYSQFSQASYTKAVLCIRNPVVARKQSKAPNSDQMKKEIQEMMKTVLDASSSAAAMKRHLIAGAGMQATYNFIEVQYNPATVVISASGGTYMSMDRSGNIGSASASAVVERHQPTQKKCSFTIIIDDCEENDAFGFSGNTSMTLSNMAGTAASAAGTLLGKKHSVKEKCEALMGLVMDSHLQDMVFCYGKMVFHGQLVSCNTKYTMFNLSGNPIRAEVRMTLLQVADPTLYEFDMIEWQNKWEKAFKTGI